MAGVKIINLAPFAAAARQLYQAPPSNIRGVDSTEWFGPLQPVKPVAPVGTEPRRFQYNPGQNLIFTPRADRSFSIDDLRKLARYDIARILIENVKDQVCRLPWTIRRRRKKGESESKRKQAEQGDKTIDTVTALLEMPNPDQSWTELLRQVLDDLLSIDAPSILLRQTKSGELKELRAIDGGTICRYIDDNGFTPAPPSPAYAQLWYGIPMVDLTTDQLLYKPRNVLTYSLYGFSPVEQAATIIAIGEDRLKFLQEYYKSGSIPDVVQIVPASITADKIREVMDWTNSELAGNLSKRHQWRMIQGFTQDGKDQVLFPKEKLLVDATDDMIIRALAFAFGTSPQRLLKMQNRSTADSSQDAAEEEGLEPWLDWVVSTFNFLIQRKMGLVEYEFAFEDFRETDVLKQSQADEIDVKSAIKAVNEVRESRGLEPSANPAASKLGVITANGFVELGEKPNDGTGDGGDAETGEDGKPTNAVSGKRTGAAAGKGSRAHTVSVGFTGSGIATESPRTVQPVGFHGYEYAIKTKGRKPEKEIKIEAHTLTVVSETATQQMKAHVQKFLADTAVSVSSQIAKSYVVKVSKADDEGDPPEEAERKAEELYAKLSIDWEKLAEQIEAQLIEAAKEGASQGVIQLTPYLSMEVKDELASSMTAKAIAEAQARAAEMVSLSYNDALQEYVNDPTARWSIADSTAADLKATIQQAYEEHWTTSQLKAVLEASETFSTERAELIARTETARMQSISNLNVWRASNVVEKVKWVMSSLHVCCDECDDAANLGAVDIGHEFLPFVFAPPAHPRCRCALQVVTVAVAAWHASLVELKMGS